MNDFMTPVLSGMILLVSACSGPCPAEGDGSAPLPEQESGTEEVVVRQVAEDFLSALSHVDTARLASMLAPGAMIYSVRDGEGGPTLREVSSEDFLESLGGEDQWLLERMWEPVVKVQGRVAMVWTPYDFHLNGEFSHCGIDVFTLLKGVEGWQVASVTYNVVREGCPPSPLGLPTRSDG